MRPNRVNLLGRERSAFPGLPRLTRSPYALHVIVAAVIPLLMTLFILFLKRMLGSVTRSVLEFSLTNILISWAFAFPGLIVQNLRNKG